MRIALKESFLGLRSPGFGFAVEPDMSAMDPAETWTFESLGL